MAKLCKMGRRLLSKDAENDFYVVGTIAQRKKTKENMFFWGKMERSRSLLSEVCDQ